MIKIIRTSTIALSLDVLLKGQLAFLNNHFEVIAASGEDEHLSIVRNREKVKTISIEMEREIAPIKDLKSLIRLYRILKKEKPTIIHSITPKAGLLSMLAGKLAGVPIRMHTFTGLIFPTQKGFKKKLLIQTDRLLCSSATHIYPEGQGVKNDLKNYGITSKPLKIIANGNVNGIDTKFFHSQAVSQETINNLKKSLGINNDDYVFVFVGRLVGDKGINELVEAFDKISDHRVKLILVGPEEAELDPLKDRTSTIIQSNNNIITTGYQPDVRPYFAISNCLVFPSYREGFPNVVMQAAAMELPAIVTDINGCNEIITNSQNGWIVPVKDIDTLKDRMQWCMENKDKAHKMGGQSRKLMKEKFEREFVWQELLKEYKRLLNLK